MDYLNDHQEGHSEFQIERFIVTRGNWTPYGRYKQVLRELDKRQRGLEELQTRRRFLLIDRDEAARSLASFCRFVTDSLWWRSAFHRRRAEIQLWQIDASLIRVDGEIETATRERTHFERLAEELRPQVGELTDERRRMLDEELWDIRVRAMAAADLITRRNLSEPTLDLLLSMPLTMRTAVLRDVRETVVAMQQGRDGPLLDWLEQNDGPKPRLLARAETDRDSPLQESGHV